MEVIIQIKGRDAIPVRAIPLLTYWQTMTHDALAQALAGDEHYFRFENMRAYRFDDGRVLPAGYWTNNVVRPLRASSDTIKVREISHEAGLQEFRTESLQKLPVGVYVWRDEFTEAHQRHYSKTTLPMDFEGNDVPLTDAEVAKLTAAHQERITLDLSPFIDPAMHTLVMQGFGVLPTDTAPAQASTTPTPVVAEQVAEPEPVVAASDGPAKRSNRKPSWATVAMPYMKSLFTAGHYKSAAVFYKALMSRAGESDSPFKLVNRELYCTEAGTTVSDGALGNVWPEIRAH